MDGQHSPLCGYQILAWGCANQSGDGETLHKLAHVNANHGRLCVEEELADCLAELRLFRVVKCGRLRQWCSKLHIRSRGQRGGAYLANTCGPQEEKRRNWAIALREARPVQAYSIAHGSQGMVLADNSPLAKGIEE